MPPCADSEEIRFGFTLRDLELMTRAALTADRSMAADISDRHDAAWHAIVEHLWTVESPPSRQELIRIGWQAIYREIRDGYRSYGYADRDPYAGHASAPRFALYWYRPVTASHEERVVERLAATQILVALTPARRDALVALAAAGGWAEAASLLGISYNTFNQRMRSARVAFLARWHEGETPHWSQYNKTRRVPGTVETSTHCPNGHERTPETTIVQTRVAKGQRRTVRRCGVCEKERSVRRSRQRRQQAA